MSGQGHHEQVGVLFCSQQAVLKPFEIARLHYLASHFCYKFLAVTFITTTAYNLYFLFLLTIFFPLKFRNDEQKHRQSGKTVSRKAQKRSEGKGKGKGSKGK